MTSEASVGGVAAQLPQPAGMSDLLPPPPGVVAPLPPPPGGAARPAPYVFLIEGQVIMDINITVEDTIQQVLH